MVSTGDVEPAVVVTNLRKALEAIGSLSSERASLEQVGCFQYGQAMPSHACGLR